MGKAIGIDLGTTNSVAAFSEAKVELVSEVDETRLPNNKLTGQYLTRSVVAYDQGKLCVSNQAYSQLQNGTDTENVIRSIKRLMGHDLGDSAVHKQKEEFSYKITQPTQGTENGIAVWLNSRE